MLAYLRKMCARNRVNVSMIGMGYHGTVMPEVIKRNVLENPGWYTAYTPYQAEISQGRLEALLNFQQMVIDLTGLPVANASLLDEATAAAEAMAMARRVAKSKSRRFLVDADCHPQTIAVVETRARHFGFDVVVGDPETWGTEQDYFGILLQYPGSSGAVRDFRAVIEAAHAQQAIATIAADPLALVMLTAPATLGADIVVGSAQRYGVSMGYGGPHAAFFATREAFVRALRPGASSACRWTATDTPRCAWRCRPANSTSAATRRRRTSAPRRSYSRSSPGSTRSTTARAASR